MDMDPKLSQRVRQMACEKVLKMRSEGLDYLNIRRREKVFFQFKMSKTSTVESTYAAVEDENSRDLGLVYKT